MRNIRRKMTICGDEKNYIELEIFPVPDIPHNIPRRRRYRESTPQQRALNDKMAKKRFTRLVQCNFKAKDYFVTLTYDPEHRPEDIVEAEKVLRNYFRRLKQKIKTKGGRLVYMAVTEESSNGNLHHHFVIKKSCNLTRDEIEAAWSTNRGRDSLGMVNCQKIQQTSSKDVTTIAAYMIKNVKGTRRWISSRNLKKPEVFISDTAISRKQYRELSLFSENGVEVREKIKKKHPGYIVTGFENYLNPENGERYIRIMLRKDERYDYQCSTKEVKEHPPYSERN